MNKIIKKSSDVIALEKEQDEYNKRLKENKLKTEKEILRIKTTCPECQSESKIVKYTSRFLLKKIFGLDRHIVGWHGAWFFQRKLYGELRKNMRWLHAKCESCGCEYKVED